MSKAKAERKLNKVLSKVSKLISDNKLNQDKEYISYFQSVTTIGIVSSGKNAKEAQEKSELKMKNSSMTYSVIAHEPFTASATDEWEPSNA